MCVCEMLDNWLGEGKERKSLRTTHPLLSKGHGAVLNSTPESESRREQQGGGGGELGVEGRQLIVNEYYGTNLAAVRPLILLFSEGLGGGVEPPWWWPSCSLN